MYNPWDSTRWHWFKDGVDMSGVPAMLLAGLMFGLAVVALIGLL
jgi:hypothetical protein